MARRTFQKTTFNPATRQVTFVDLTTLDKSRILLITNSTQNRVIYNPNATGLGGTVSGNVLTLTFDTTTHGANDDLIVAYENGDNKVGVLSSAILVVSYVNILSGGAGYTSAPTVAFVGNASTVQPAAIAIINNGSVVGIQITNPGVSTVAPTSVTLTGGGFTTAATCSTPTCGQFVRQAIDGESKVTFQTLGSWAATLQLEATIDGNNYFALKALNQTDGTSLNSSWTANILAESDIGAYRYVQIRCSAYTSGQVLVNLKLSNATGQVGVKNALPTGFNNIGTAQVNLNAGSNLVGGFNNRLATANGYTIARLMSSAATTNATILKASAGNLYRIQYKNATATERYLKIYNKATAPTAGTDTPILTIPLKANISEVIDLAPFGITGPTGLGYAITGAITDLDATAIVAGDIVGLHLFYN
jgi:hypothetical protein